MTIYDAIALMPPGYHLSFEWEPSATPGAPPFLSSSLYQCAPEDGWTDQSWGRRLHPADDRFADKIVASVTCNNGDYEAYDRLTIWMLCARFDPSWDACELDRPRARPGRTT